MPSLLTIARVFLDRMLSRMPNPDAMTDSEYARLLSYAVHCAMRYHNLYA